MKRPSSFELAKKRRSRIMYILKALVLIFICFELISVFGVKSWVIGSSTMIPTLEPKDRVLVAMSAYGFYNPFNAKRHLIKKPEPGDLVLLRLPSSSPHTWYMRMVNSFIRFISLQQSGIVKNYDSNLVVKRIIAGPGDTVKMDAYIIHVKAAGSVHFLTEYEVSNSEYEIRALKQTEAWSNELALSGNMAEIILGPEEFFVVGDDRLSFADSRFFGPVKSSLIEGKLVLRYWPFNKFGRL